MRGRTQEIADAAFFLGFDGLIAPSARWPCSNFVLFTDRIPPGLLDLAKTSEAPIDWSDWRKTMPREIRSKRVEHASVEIDVEPPNPV